MSRKHLERKAVGEAAPHPAWLSRGEPAALGRRPDGDAPAGQTPSSGDAAQPWPAAPPEWRATIGERVIQGAVAALLAGTLVLGLALKPSPTGTGTHQALGLPPCGMLVMTGHPCPTCGVTTSFVLAVHGRFADALVNQPFGLIVFVGVVAGLAAALVTLIRGRTWAPLARVSVVTTAAIVLVVLVLASWAYKWATT